MRFRFFGTILLGAFAITAALLCVTLLAGLALCSGSLDQSVHTKVDTGVQAVPRPTIAAPATQTTLTRASIALSNDVADPPTTSAELTDYGTDKDTYHPGEAATGFIVVKNTGNTAINEVTTSVSARRSVPVIGSITVGSQAYTSRDLNIGPGETRRIEFTQEIPAEYKGISTAGDYTFDVTVKVGDTEVGSFSKSVKVT